MTALFNAPDGRRLEFHDTGGDGTALLCLAGLTRNIRDFAHIPAQWPGRRVIRLSSRGRGGSDRAADPMVEYQVPVEAGDALALLDHLGISRVGVLGTSRGGILGMAMAAMRPGLVASLILNDVGAMVDVAGLLRIRDYVGVPPHAKNFTEAAQALARAHAADFPGVPLARWETHARAIYDGEGAPTLSYDPAIALTLAALDEAGPQIDLRPLFAACATVPTLVIRGANSNILSAQTLADMQAGHPDLTAVTAADRGHAPFLDEPEAAAAIRAHLDRTLPQ
ncbi:MAG: pimeloyl-ACP methyl ester carboxylesterase [Paracoccaceae bacterium]